MKRRIEVGLLYSLGGSYASIGKICRQGALAAIQDINNDPSYDLEFVPIERSPNCNVDLYAPLCKEILRDSSARHIIGCVTSWSRKEVIPVLERSGGTLWYAMPYEGFEASEHVAYMHGCSNQHLVPILKWAFPQFGSRAYLVGSNYTWGWESHRIARQMISKEQGEVLGEKYLNMGDVDVDDIIEEIKKERPDFILNSLVDDSKLAFLRAFHQLGLEDERFSIKNCPILSCNLSEVHLGRMDTKVSDGLFSIGPYFKGCQGWPEGGIRSFSCSFEASNYSAVCHLAQLLNGVPGAQYAKLSHLMETPNGTKSRIDPLTHHVKLPVYIAEAKGGRFYVIEDLGIMSADPYLTRHDDEITNQRPLKLASG